MPSGRNHYHPVHVPDRSDDWQGPRRVLSCVPSRILEQRRHVGERPLGPHLLCLGEPLQGSGVTRSGSPHAADRRDRPSIARSIRARDSSEIRCSALTPGSRCPSTTTARLLDQLRCGREQRCCGQVGRRLSAADGRVRATRDSRASDRPRASPSAPGPSPLPRRARGAPAREAASADRR